MVQGPSKKWADAVVQLYMKARLLWRCSQCVDYQHDVSSTSRCAQPVHHPQQQTSTMPMNFALPYCFCNIEAIFWNDTFKHVAFGMRQSAKADADNKICRWEHFLWVWEHFLWVLHIVPVALWQDLETEALQSSDLWYYKMANSMWTIYCHIRH